MKLMRIAEWRDADQGAVFATEGRPVDGLRLLFSGEVNVERDGRETAHGERERRWSVRCRSQGGDASATVTTVPCRYVFWSGKACVAPAPKPQYRYCDETRFDLTRKLTGDNTGTIGPRDLD